MSGATAELELIVAELDCADEAAQIEGALGRLPAVAGVRTSVAAHKVLVRYNPSGIGPNDLRAAIAGLGMTVRAGGEPVMARSAGLAECLGALFVTAVALVALVGILGERLGLLEAVTARVPAWLTISAVLLGGFPIFRNVLRALRNRTVTSHALMTLGIVGALAIGQYAAAAVIVFFMRLGDFLERFTTERSRHAIRALLTLAPETARIETDGRDVEIPATDVRPGQVVLVKPGERIPVDGRVQTGHGTVNQAPITGESMSVEKTAGDPVFAATVLDRGFLRVTTERVGAATTFGRIVALVEEAETHKAPVQRFADRFTAYYTPVVVGAALLTYLVGRDPSAAVAVVLVACSCAITMATPTVVLASVGRAARRGLIVEGGRSLEALAKVDTLIMDKTGTVTFGTPRVTEVVALDGLGGGEVLARAAAAERYSEHPVASAVVAEAQRRHLPVPSPGAFEVIPGEGVVVAVGADQTACGNARLMARRGVTLPRAVVDRATALEAQGRTVVYLAAGARLLGLIAVADTLRPEVPEALTRLRALGLRRILLLTGDNDRVARALAAELGVDYRAECLPEEKIEVVRQLQAGGAVVAMVGDGINDAPALAQADVGIAMGAAGTDAAIEAAHVALMRDDWRLVPEAIEIGRRAFRTIQQNLWFTAAYNFGGILLAALGWLPPIGAAAAQSLPDVAVMLNSSRLLRARGGGVIELRRDGGEETERMTSGGHEMGHRHDEHTHRPDHGHGHDHGSGHGHTHGIVDPEIASTARGVWALKWSFAGLLVTALFQVVVVVLSGSVALLADTIHNFADAATAIPLWIAFWLARRGATRRFTYGLGRVEDLAGVVIIVTILASALVAAYEAVSRVLHPQPVQMLGAVVVASIIGFLGNETVAVFRIRVGRQIGSAALVADGYHARVDGWTSLAVLVGVLGVWAGYPLADPVVGLLISAAIVWLGCQAAGPVLVRILDGVETERVDAIRHAAGHVPGVQEVTDVRARWIGHRLHAELSVSVSPALSVGDAHAIATEVRHHLLHDVPHTGGVTVHVDPLGKGGDRHHAIAEHAHDGLPLHAHP